MGIQIKGGKKPLRNDPCPCGSKLKAKYCHLDPLKQAVCNRVANEKMVELIRAEQLKRGLIALDYKCNNCGHTFDEPEESELLSNVQLCPKCMNTNIEYIGGE